MAVRIPDLTSMILQKIVETLFCFLGVVFLISEIIYFIVKPPISRSPFSIFSLKNVPKHTMVLGELGQTKPNHHLNYAYFFQNPKMVEVVDGIK